MKKKDVLFLCQFFYPEYVSSATLPFDTALAISEAGYSVEVLCGYPKEYNLDTKTPVKETYKNIKIKRLKYIQLSRKTSIGRLINFLSFTFSVALRFFKLRKYKTIIVYSNPPILPIIPAVSSILFKTKIVFVCYDVYPEIAQITNAISVNGIISKIMRTINKIMFKRFTKVVALSNEMKQILLQIRSFLNESMVEVIPNWYEDKGCLNNRKVDKSFQTLKSCGEFIVSYFGNMGICQEFDTIIDAIRHLKHDNSIKFIFAGHGNKKDELKNIIANEDCKNVVMYDFLHGNDYDDALYISDCFLVSLAKGLTGMCVPSKTYGYLMAGKPIISIMDGDSDIVTDIVDGKMGFAINIGDSMGLVGAIKELQLNNDKINEMGKNSRNTYLEKYTTKKCTEKYVNLIKTILKEKVGSKNV